MSVRATTNRQTLKSTVLAYAGNVALTSTASSLPDTPPSRVDRQDQIKRGKKSLFGRHSQFIQNIYIVLPILVTLHAVCIVMTIYSPSHQNNRPSIGSRLRFYFCGPCKTMSTESDLQDVQGTVTSLLWRMLLPSCVLSCCGLALAILNSASPSVYGEYINQHHSDCVDGYMKTTMAVTVPTTWYQWSWVCVNSMVLIGLAVLTTRMILTGRSEMAVSSVHNCLCTLGDNTTAETRAFSEWQSKVHATSKQRSRKPIRKSMYYFLHLPIMVVLSIPSFAYVLVRNLPESGVTKILTYSVGNPVAFSIWNSILSAVVIPKFGKTLSKIRFGTRALKKLKSDETIGPFKAQV